jgi:hypothetical protein
MEDHCLMLLDNESSSWHTMVYVHVIYHDSFESVMAVFQKFYQGNLYVSMLKLHEDENFRKLIL